MMYALRLTGPILSLLVITITASAALTFRQGKSGEDEVERLFAGYPESPELAGIIFSHRNFGLKRKGLILYATWFPDGNPRVAYRCFASADGLVSSDRWVFELAKQASRTAQLDERRLEALRDSIRALPQSPQPPPLADLLIVSFREGEGWKIRTYDRKNVPEEVKNIYKTTGCTNWYDSP